MTSEEKCTLRNMMMNLYNTRHEVYCDYHWKNWRIRQIRWLIDDIRKLENQNMGE